MLVRFVQCLAISLLFASIAGCSDDEGKQAEKAERHLKSAQVYHRQGQYRAAMLEARNVLQQGGPVVPAYELLADIYNQVGAFRQTQKIPEDIVRQSDVLAIAMAESYVASKKYRSALELLDALVLSPDTEKGLRYYKIKGEALLYSGEFQALEQLTKSLGSDAGNTSAEVLRGYLEAAYQLTGNNPSAAQNRLDEVLALDPDYFPALTLRGDIALYFNQREDAERYYTDALATLPSADVITAERTVVLGRLIETLTQLGRTTEAYAYQKVLSEANPNGISAQQRFSEALEHFSNGNLDEAFRILQELNEQFPEDSNAGTLLGVVSQKMGDFERADELFGQFLDAETVTPSVIQAATIAKLSQQEPQQALSMLKQACEMQPENAGIWATYGLALAELKADPKEVVMALERSLALNNKQSRLRIALANAYRKLGKDQQAVAQLSKAYELAPTDFLVQQAYYRYLAFSGETDQLTQLVGEFTEAYPDLAQGYFFTGWLLTNQKKYPAAESAFERALSLNDGRMASLTHAALAQLHEKQGELVKVTQDWENAIVAAPAALYAYQRWLISLHKRNLADNAATRLAALKIPDSYWQPEYVLANLAFREQNFDKTLDLLKLVQEKQPDLELAKVLAAQTYQQKAFAAYAVKDVNGAKAYMLKASAEQPGHMGYLANLVKLDLEAGDTQGARQLLAQFDSEKGDQPTRAFLEGKILEYEEKLPDAMSAYRQSWDEAASDLAGQSIFNLLQKRSEPAKAALFLDEWHEKLPTSAQPLVYKAMNAQGQKDDESAKAFYLKALEINGAQPLVLNNLAWIVQKESKEQALEYARKAYELAPTSAAIVDTFGWMLVEAGEVRQGYEYLQQALALAPENAEIKQHVDEARARL